MVVAKLSVGRVADPKRQITRRMFSGRGRIEKKNKRKGKFFEEYSKEDEKKKRKTRENAKAGKKRKTTTKKGKGKSRRITNAWQVANL